MNEKWPSLHPSPRWRHLEKKRVCIFAAVPATRISPPIQAATCANEMACEAIFKAPTRCVYDKRPRSTPMQCAMTM